MLGYPIKCKVCNKILGYIPVKTKDKSISSVVCPIHKG